MADIDSFCDDCGAYCSNVCSSNCATACDEICSSYCTTNCSGSCVGTCEGTETLHVPLNTRKVIINGKEVETGLDVLIKTAQALHNNTVLSNNTATEPKQDDLITKEVIKEYINIVKNLYEENLGANNK